MRLAKLISERAEHGCDVLFRPGWAIVSIVVLGLGGALLTWRDELLPHELKEKLRVLKMLPHWDWGWWAVIVSVLVILLVLEFSFRKAQRLSAAARTVHSRVKYLETAMIVGAWNETPPSYLARFARSGRDSDFYLEYRWHRGPGSYTEWQSVPIHHVDRFAPGTQVEFPIANTVKTPAGEQWFFGAEPELNNNGYPTRPLIIGQCYQGIVKFLNPDGEFEPCYFIVKMPEAPKKVGPMAVHDTSTPRVFGEHMMSHIFEREGIPPPNENPARLARLG
jgi:hypothetical protein